MKYFLALATVLSFLVPVSFASAQPQAIPAVQSVFAGGHPVTAEKVHDMRARHKYSHPRHSKAYRHDRYRHSPRYAKRHHRGAKPCKYKPAWKTHKGRYC